MGIKYAGTVAVMMAWGALGCGLGAPTPVSTEEQAASMAGESGAGVLSRLDASVGETDSAIPMAQRDASEPMVVGDPCERGTSEECECEGSDAMGERTCMASAASPTGGIFSECRGCPAPKPDAGACDPDAGDDCGGSAGASGMSSAGAGGMSSGGAGGTTSGGAGGTTAGTGGAGGAGGAPAACTCTMLLQCCRPDGSCGLGVAPLCV